MEQLAPSWETISVTTKTERFHARSQETGHLPTAVGQAILVSGQTNQLHLQPGDAEETVHKLHQLALSQMIEMKLPGQEGKLLWLQGL